MKVRGTAAMQHGASASSGCLTLPGSKPYRGKYVCTKSPMVVLHRCLCIDREQQGQHASVRVRLVGHLEC
jgi:hypothetical protein